MDDYESDHVFFPGIAGVEIVGIIVVVIEEELSDAVSLVVVGESSGTLKLHRLFKSMYYSMILPLTLILTTNL